MVYVSHDLAVIAQLVDRVAVMYAGTIVEEGPVATVFATPRHPYTGGLVASIPDHVEPRRLRGIPGVAVGVFDRPRGCPFAPRCADPRAALRRGAAATRGGRTDGSCAAPSGAGRPPSAFATR